jgi:copper chaperone
MRRDVERFLILVQRHRSTARSAHTTRTATLFSNVQPSHRKHNDRNSFMTIHKAVSKSHITRRMAYFATHTALYVALISPSLCLIFIPGLHSIKGAFMTVLSVPSMSCGHCKASILTALSPLAAVSMIDIDLAKRQVSADGPAEIMIQALAKAGFDATVLENR